MTPDDLPMPTLRLHRDGKHFIPTGDTVQVVATIGYQVQPGP